MNIQILNATRADLRKIAVVVQTSPVPTSGLLFNEASTNQMFDVSAPASTNGIGISMWLKKKGSWSSGYLFDARGAVNESVYQLDGGGAGTRVYAPDYSTVNPLPSSNLRYLDPNIWHRVFINILNPTNAGLLPFLRRYTGLEPITNIEFHDVIIYNRQFTAAEVSDATGVSSDGLWARYLLDTGTTGTTLDDTSAGSHDGILYGF